MQEKKSQNVDIILNKLRDALHIRTDLALANFLEVKANTISTWRSRNTLDYELIISKCDNIDFNWLFANKRVSYSVSETEGHILNEPLEKFSPKPCENCKSKDKIIADLIKENQKQSTLIEKLIDKIPSADTTSKDDSERKSA